MPHNTGRPGHPVCAGMHPKPSATMIQFVYVAITLRSGRPPAQKRALYRRIAELAHAYAGTEMRNMAVTLTENESVDWSLGNGVAQYADSAEGADATDPVRSQSAATGNRPFPGGVVNADPARRVSADIGVRGCRELCDRDFAGHPVARPMGGGGARSLAGT